MPQVFTCANGHRWELSSGQEAAAGGPLCPVCGGTDATRACRDEAATTRPGTAADRAGAEQGWPEVPGYQVLEEVGRGGMGVVYRARQAGTGRTVALKVILPERLANPDAVRRFRREAQAAARLSHPHLVLVHDSDQSGDTHYLAMEFVAGVTLQRLVELNGPLPAGQACDYVRQVALGLQHAHEQALVHRDIKPANLMVTAHPAREPSATWQGGLVKILDMGVARLYQLSDRHENSLSTLTHDGAVLGTPDYVAPEQLEDAHHADIRADLYSLGCTFYFLLTGRPPFPEGTLLQKLDKQRWATPPSVDQVRPEVPAAVAAVVRRLLAKRPADRYQTPAELAGALEQLGRTGYVAVDRPPPIPPTVRLPAHPGGVTGLAAAPDGRTVLSGGRDRALRLWDVAAGREVRCLAGLGQEVRAVAVSPDGRHCLAAGGATLRLRELDTLAEVLSLGGHTDAVTSVAFAPDGRWAVSAGHDRTVRLWDLTSGREFRRLAGHRREVSAAAVSADGLFALTGGRDQTLRLWDLQAGRDLRRFPAQKGQVLAVAFAPDGRRCASGNFDTTVRLWDTATGRELRRLHGHKQMVAAVAFSADGRLVLSGGPDRSVRLWDAEGGHELCCFAGHSAPVTAVAFLPDGRHAVSGGADGLLCLWRLPNP